MIFKISNRFITSVPSASVSDFMSDIMEHGHYVDCDYKVQQSLIQAIDTNGSTTQKELLRKYKRFDVTNELRTYLTTIDTDNYTQDQLMIMVSVPSYILMENLREWPIYQSLIGTYKKDRMFSNLFQLLEMSKCNKQLQPLQSGGVGDMKQVFETYNKNVLKDVAAHKMCFVFDRDTNGSDKFSWNGTIKFLSGKDKVEELNNGQIYTLQQRNYIWHMWYRRDIENYFPEKCFIALGYSVKDPSLVGSYYVKAEEKYIKGEFGKYDKNDTSHLPAAMSKADYEVGLQTFIINGLSINELQLLLLKFVKII